MTHKSWISAERGWEDCTFAIPDASKDGMTTSIHPSRPVTWKFQILIVFKFSWSSRSKLGSFGHSLGIDHQFGAKRRIWGTVYQTETGYEIDRQILYHLDNEMLLLE
jgi:hypothetical protein